MIIAKKINPPEETWAAGWQRGGEGQLRTLPLPRTGCPGQGCPAGGDARPEAMLGQPGAEPGYRSTSRMSPRREGDRARRDLWGQTRLSFLLSLLVSFFPI